MSWIAAGAAAVSVGSKIYADSQANKARKKADKQKQALVAGEDARNTALFNREYYQNYLDKEGNRATLEQIRKNMKEATKITANSSVQGGATPEAVVATEGKMQDKYQNAILGMSQAGQASKDQQLWRYQALNAQMFPTKMGLIQDNSQQWQNFNDNVSGATNSIMGAWANGAFQKKPGFVSDGTNDVPAYDYSVPPEEVTRTTKAKGI